MHRRDPRQAAPQLRHGQPVNLSGFRHAKGPKTWGPLSFWCPGLMFWGGGIQALEFVNKLPGRHPIGSPNSSVCLENCFKTAQHSLPNIVVPTKSGI